MGVCHIELNNFDISFNLGQPADVDINYLEKFSTDEEFMFDSSLSFEVNMDNNSLWNALWGSPPRDPYILTVEIPRLRQKRVHKKKRINKKWAKRYGYVLYTETLEVECPKTEITNNQNGLIDMCVEYSTIKKYKSN